MIGETGRVVVVTGAAGNLGRKAVALLTERDWCTKVICLDIRGLDDPFFHHDKIATITCDLVAADDERWHGAVAAADAIVHLAATDPSPGASWSDAAASFDITANLLTRIGHKPCRFIFASSNHAMGGYKEQDPGPGFLKSSTPPWPGTLMFDRRGQYRSTAYGSAKLMGERAATAKAVASGGMVTSISMRIGWCLRDGHGPGDVSDSGSSAPPGQARDATEEARDLRWFRNMWLSRRDFMAECEAAILAEAANWPAPGIVINGVSANRGTPWDMAEARAWIGHVPRDDVWTELGTGP